jgi:FkbM family methyltransferase
MKRLVKTKLLQKLGPDSTALVLALRFVWLLKTGFKSDEPEKKILPQLIKKGDTVIDVGANGADWTLATHQIVRKSGYVFAFEADPLYAKATELTVQLLRLQSVSVFRFGLSDRRENVCLKISDSNGQRLSGESRVLKGKSHADEDGCVHVQLEKLDHLTELFPGLLNASLIKCDVEGYELFVFKGAQNLFRTTRPIVIYENEHFETFHYSGQDIYEFFQKLDYCSFSCIRGGKIALTDERLRHEKAVSNNRLMLPAELTADIVNRINNSDPFVLG